ncbi:MAG: SPASM domain-containing protein [Desulfobacteraceae bacterium]|nr:SPASM domain-containing protein [Desulfobacteraceae bacterium]
MAPNRRAFEDLTHVTLQVLVACNLSCDYCFQDACNVTPSPRGEDRTVDPIKAAQATIELLKAAPADLSLTFSGGEPMLAPVEWYGTFFTTVGRYLQESGKKLSYSVQTNISILRPGIIDLFRKQNVHFSVHYDGMLDDPKLLSKQRRDNIATLSENGFTITALVVGTVASLRALPETMEFLRNHGVRYYRINYVSSQGRGYQASKIPPELRAEAEFESAFLASQYDFQMRDNVVMNKFLFYYNNVVLGKEQIGKPRPQRCRAGAISVCLAADGFAYPCSFFTQLTGPMARTSELPSLMEGASEALGRVEASNPYYDGKCRQCSALPICGEYCPLSPVTDTNCVESFCNAQVALRGLMDSNRELTELIARRFIGHRRGYPGDVPRSCGGRP